MDNVFFMDVDTRTLFIRALVRKLGWTYICLWACQLYPSKCLVFMDGWFNDEGGQPSSSSGSFPRTLFESYCQSLLSLDNGVPGLAHSHGMEDGLWLGGEGLINLASTDNQRRFYQGAGIENAFFMSCQSGVIELGTSNPNVDLNMNPKNLITDDVIRQFQQREPPPWADPSRASSSSSSLPSLSVGSPEYSNPAAITPPHLTIPAPAAHSITLTRMLPGGIPTSYEAIITRAILDVVSSSPSSLSRVGASRPSQRPGAFQRYNSSGGVKAERRVGVSQRLFKRSIAVLRRIREVRQRVEEGAAAGTRPASSTQLHHVISERRRREKLNELFQALRAMLPLDSKKDKASILSRTREYLGELKVQVKELNERNISLETRLSSRGVIIAETALVASQEIETVEITETADDREIELRVRVVLEHHGLEDLVVRILQRLKRMEGFRVLSVSADSQVQPQFDTAIFRFNVQGGRWDKSWFEEEIRKELIELQHT
ncbi:putative transcription factor bHLH041 [Amborella trichopoda]|uniref:BHLH domain-containing protein n=1 Tax=Amborella trichopoda TaxID=13333 RepID=U5DHA9_AMBTC|nr:putative transcription factor bHLH041 [Amborella trichopoda]ERN19848.1 hypothetical protein AMTR_s00064p00208400 [Amborella trichopoda]|eukprot:XP_020531660.1 putative transcription factor bHLH041 [Amborella trichopoda]